MQNFEFLCIVPIVPEIGYYVGKPRPSPCNSFSLWSLKYRNRKYNTNVSNFLIIFSRASPKYVKCTPSQLRNLLHMKKILGRPKVEGQYAVHNLFFVLKHNLRTTAAYWAQCRKLLIGRGSGLPSSEKNWELTLSPRPYDTLENSDSWNF